MCSRGEHSTSYIFTDFQSSDELGTATAREYAAAARERHARFVSVVLACDPTENERCLGAPERAALVAGGKGLLQDVELLRDMRGRVGIHTFGTPDELRLDVTQMEPSAAAARIAEHTETVCGG